MKALKIFGGMIFYNGEQVRGIVAAYTKKQAIELLNTVTYEVSYFTFNNYFTETGNSIELSVAIEVGVWITYNNFSKKTEDYIKIK